MLNIVAIEDHIAPPAQTEGVMAGSAAIKRTWPQIDAWLAPRSGGEGARPR